MTRRPDARGAGRGSSGIPRGFRNLDEAAYRALKARVALEGKTMGEAVNEAIRAYLSRPEAGLKPGSLLDLEPEPWPEGNERASEEVDALVYGGVGRSGKTL